VIAFTDPAAPRPVRIARALTYMQTLLGNRAGHGPTNELYELLAERYDITRDELARAWIKAGFS
jgi:hypothetical protein